MPSLASPLPLIRLRFAPGLSLFCGTQSLSPGLFPLFPQINEHEPDQTYGGTKSCGEVICTWLTCVPAENTVIK